MSRYSNVFDIKTAKDNIPPVKEISNRESDIYIQFNSTDRLDLVSHRVYGDPQYWWIILGANDYQLEFDIVDGELLRIPYPLVDVLNEIRESV